MSKLLEKDNNSTDDQSDSENQKMSIKINDKVQKGGKDVIMTEEKKEISQEVKKDMGNMQCDERDEKKEGVKDSVKSSMEDVNSTPDALKPTSDSTKPARETEKKEPDASKATIGSTNSTSEPSKSILEATKPTSEATKPTSEATNPTSEALKPPLETTQPPPTSSEPIKPTQFTPEIKEEIIDYSEFPPDTVTTLTKNGIKILHDNDQVWGKTDPQRNLTLQILECREMGAKSEGKFKMRFKLSDGFSSITVVLCKSDSTPTNDNTEYKKFGIVKIIRPRLLKVNKTNILTIQVNPEIIYGFSYNKIGTPIDYTERILTGNFPETVPTPYIDKDDIKAHIKGGIK